MTGGAVWPSRLVGGFVVPTSIRPRRRFNERAKPSHEAQSCDLGQAGTTRQPHIFYPRDVSGVCPLCDLAHMTDCWQPAQWQALEQRATEYGLGPVVYLMLTLEEQLLGMTAPAGVVEGLRPEGLDPLPEDLLERLLPGENSLAAHVPMALVRAEGKETVLAGVRHFFSRLLLPREAMAAIYGVPADSACIWLT